MVVLMKRGNEHACKWLRAKTAVSSRIESSRVVRGITDRKTPLVKAMPEQRLDLSGEERKRAVCKESRQCW